MYTLVQRKKAERDFSSAGSFFLLKAEQFLAPLLDRLDGQLDKRLVRTFFDVFVSVLRFRNRPLGLILSELGAYVLSPQQSCAGTKRISNLLRSPKWTHEVVETFLIEQAEKRLDEFHVLKQRALLLWDDSVLEKPESWYSEGLCSVASSKAKRLTRIKTGFYSPPKARICVPGFEWTSVVLTTLQSAPSLVCMRWWTTRGKYISDRKSQFLQLFKHLSRTLTHRVIHVLDRWYADTSILTRIISENQYFIVRWVKTYNLKDVHGLTQKTQLHARSHKDQLVQVIWDAPRKQYRRVAISYQIVFLPKHPDHALTLVVCRDSKHKQEPMYLLTNCPVVTKTQAWNILFCYMRRWTIEQTFRFTKSELAMESPRLWKWENRLKLLIIIALIYDFILKFLRSWPTLARKFINIWCPRTGKRQLETQLPLYRLRCAIAHLLNDFVAQNSG